MRKPYWILFGAGIIFFQGDAQEQFFQTAEESKSKVLSGGVHDLSGVDKFRLPKNSISFLLSVYNENGASGTGVLSLTNPQGDDLVNRPPLGGRISRRKGYGGMLVPMVPEHSALSGEWKFAIRGGEQVKLTFRIGATPTNSTVTVQAYLSGSKYLPSEIQPALNLLQQIYENAGVTIRLETTKTLSENEFSSVSVDFSDSTTGRLVSQGKAGVANIFFVEDFTGSFSGLLGIAPGIPGAQGIRGNWNGVLVSLDAHLVGGILNNQVLGETAAHELGHWFGLFHTTEKFGTFFDPLSDTAECPISLASNPAVGVQVSDCAGFGAENNMFWTGSATVDQTTFTADQIHIINYSPIAR